MKCMGCIFNKEASKEIPLSKIIDTSQQLYNDGYRKITITGGDPLYRKDLNEIIDSLYDIGFRIHLDTSGIPLLKDFSIKGLDKKIYLIGIPLDGSTDKIHKEFRDTCPVSIKDIEKIISLLERNNFRITINTVVNKHNIDDLQNIYNIISKYDGVKRWELHQFSTKISTREDIKISDDIFRGAVLKINNTNGIEISPKFSIEKELKKVVLFEDGGDGGN